MKEIKSYLVIVGLTALAFVAVHYLILFLGLNDLLGLLLLALPLVAVIAYTTTETRRICFAVHYQSTPGLFR